MHFHGNQSLQLTLVTVMTLSPVEGNAVAVARADVGGLDVGIRPYSSADEMQSCVSLPSEQPTGFNKNSLQAVFGPFRLLSHYLQPAFVGFSRAGLVQQVIIAAR